MMREDSGKKEEQLKRIVDMLLINGTLLGNSGLWQGKMGVAVFFFHYARYTGNELFEDYAIDIIKQIQAEIHANSPVDYNRGLAGIGAGIEYLVQNGFLNIDTDEVLEDFDNRIRHDIMYQPQENDSLRNGLTGLGQYLLWRIVRPQENGNVSQFKTLLASQETNKDDKFKQSISESFLKEKSLFEKMDHVICLSENTRQILLADYRIMSNKVAVIYNGLTGGNHVIDKQALKRKYHIPDVPIFLFSGRLDEIKGLRYALQAFKIVLNTRTDCHFIIAGNGAFDMYMKECEDIWMHVTWTGLIDRAKLYDLYSIADIGIMPSLHEQGSYVAIEMMMHGVPLIASTSTGLREMVEDGVTGLHIPVVEYPDKVNIDISLLAEKMLYLLQHPEERKRMGANARERYERIYSSDAMRENMLNLYTSL